MEYPPQGVEGGVGFGVVGHKVRVPGNCDLSSDAVPCVSVESCR